MNNNQKTNSYIYIGPIGLGLLAGSTILLILGLVLALIPINYFQNNSYWSNFFYTLSSAFVASSVLTVTLEYANNFQRKKDIDNVIQQIQGFSNTSYLSNRFR